MSSTLGHQTGYLYGYCLNFLLGATAVWLDVWNPAEAARLIEAERVTFTMGATPFLQDLTYVGGAPRPLLAPALHLRRRVDPAPARGGRPRAAPLRDLGGLGHDRERPGHVQRLSTTPRTRCSAPTASPLPGHGPARRRSGRARRAARRRGRSPRHGPRPVRRATSSGPSSPPRRTRPTAGSRPATAPRSTRRLPRHHRPLQGRDHPRRREHPRGRGGERCSSRIPRSPASPSSACPTRGFRSARARS